MRAFIFSLDAFVAFMVALIAIYSLIFFSSIPSSYYYLLTQGHYLTRDILLALSTTECNPGVYSCAVTGSLLDSIVAEDNEVLRNNLIQSTIGDMVPDEFGYMLEVSGNEGESWSEIYDTRDIQGEEHKGKGKKMFVSSQVMTFGYRGELGKQDFSKYGYLTCSGDILITCGEDALLEPEQRGDAVPDIETVLLKFTVFI